MTNDNHIGASIDILIAYKNGQMNLAEAVERFCFLTGLSQHLGRQFLEGLSRSNVINLKKGPK